MNIFIKLSLTFYICYLFLLPVYPVLTIHTQNLWQSTVFAAENTPPTTKFIYDGDGVRVAKIEDGETIVYAGGVDKNITTGETIKYYAFGSRRVAIKDNSGTNYIVSDHLSSVRALTDLDGVSKTKLSYYPYGQVRSQTGISSTRQYTGQINDTSIGLYFYNARYYNPITANFTQADTNNTIPNRYSYALSNPIFLNDPSGHEPEDTGGGVQLPVILEGGKGNECDETCLVINGVSQFLEMGLEIKSIIDDYMRSGFEERQAQWAEVKRVEDLGVNGYGSYSEYFKAYNKAMEPITMSFVIGSMSGMTDVSAGVPDGFIRLFHGSPERFHPSIASNGIRAEANDLNPNLTTDFKVAVRYTVYRARTYFSTTANKVVTDNGGYIYDVTVPKSWVQSTEVAYRATSQAPLDPLGRGSIDRIIPPQYINHIYRMDKNFQMLGYASRQNNFKWIVTHP